MHEAKIIVKGRKVKIDGQICLDVNRAIGLMDVLEFIPSGEAFRFIAKNSDILRPVPISHQETKSKIAKVSRKVKVKGGKLQYGFHDGKTIISDEEMNVGDSCILSIPEMKVTNRIKFEKGCSALVTRGENAGVIGRVEDVREGIFSLPKRALLSFANRSVELPVDIVIPVVPEEPAIRVSQE
jgi:small subunit ribosomal protein S4e